jgi:hypothetical protein
MHGPACTYAHDIIITASYSGPMELMHDIHVRARPRAFVLMHNYIWKRDVIVVFSTCMHCMYVCLFQHAFQLHFTILMGR